jgi:signal transduction histidine kinase
MEATPGVAFLVAMLAFPAAGLLVVTRRPHNAVGWLLLTIGLVWLAGGLAAAYAVYALVDPGGLSGGDWAAWAWDYVLWIPGIALVGALMLVFPDGRLPSRRWWPVAAVMSVSAGLVLLSLALRPGQMTNYPDVANPVGVSGFAVIADPLEMLGNAGFMVAGAATVIALAVRYRRAGIVARHQLKWFLFAGVLIGTALFTANGLQAAGAPPEVLGPLRVLPLAALPVATTVAVLRHRLFDINIVINKSMLYAGLAGFVALVYVAAIAGVGALVGAGGSAAVPAAVVATAVAAVAFQPVRQRLQRLADRLVYGHRATPYEVLASFTQRMAAAYPAGTAPAEIARVVGTGIGAQTADVWLRQGGDLRLAARWPQGLSNLSVPVSGMETVAGLPDAQRVYPIHHQGRLLGAVGVTKAADDPVTAAEDRLLRDLAATAWLVLDNAAMVGELRASRKRLVATQDAERRRVERNLHDGAQQRLLEIALALRMAHHHLERDRTEQAGATIATAQQQLRAALAELRDLARGIHPAILTERGLGPALESLAERAPLPVTVAVTDHARLPATHEATAYFVAAEALANVIKHAGARTASISLAASDGRLRLTVVDDGAGGADATAPGLAGLADRVMALDGELTVVSPPGDGTRVHMDLPCG